MFLLMRRGSAIFLFLALAAGLRAGDDISSLEIGATAPDFDLPGVDGQRHRLGDYASAEVLAIVFTCNHCPSAQAAEGRIKRLVEDMRGKSFQLVAISPNDPGAVRVNELGYAVYGDSLEEMKAHAAEQGFNFPYLYDGETQAVSRAYGAQATPHVFVFDGGRKLRYVGRFDDSKFGDAATVKSQDARNAIEALLAGRPVPVEKTKVHGCSTKWASKRHVVTEFEKEFLDAPVAVEPIDVAGVKALIANPTEKLRLFNFWATWCGPCRAEMAGMVRAARQFETRGFDLVTVSMDDAKARDKVLRALEDEHVALPRLTAKSLEKEGRATNNYHFSGDTDALVDAVGNGWAGPVPFTLLVAPGGKVIWRQQGEAGAAELRRQIVGHLGRFYQP